LEHRATRAARDAADHPPIVDARLASRVGRQGDPRELPIRQPEMIAFIGVPPPERCAALDVASLPDRLRASRASDRMF
jgi:hypothetical protein